MLIASEPVDDAREIPVDQPLVLTFNKNVIYLEVRENNQQAITLWAGEQQVPAEIVMADDQLEFEKRQTITVRPLEPLQSATAYTIRIDTSMVSKSGSHLAAPVEIRFYTVGYRQLIDPAVWISLILVALAVAGLAAGLYWRKKAAVAKVATQPNTEVNANTPAGEEEIGNPRDH